MKKVLLATTGLFLTGLNTANAAISFEGGSNAGKVEDNIKGSQDNAFTVVSDWIAVLTNFLYFIAFAMILWAGFNILTAAGDEEKVKKGKSIMIQAVIGLAVIFIASSIVQLVIGTIFGTGVQ